jgi:hypothetical protein
MDAHTPHESTTRLALFAGIGLAAAYLLYKLTQIGAPIVAAAGQAVSAGTSAAANLWVSLTAYPAVGVIGNVAMPDGSVAPVASLEWKQDTQGNAYTQVNGSVYELAPRDGAGDFTLTQVA